MPHKVGPSKLDLMHLPVLYSQEAQGGPPTTGKPLLP